MDHTTFEKLLKSRRLSLFPRINRVKHQLPREEEGKIICGNCGVYLGDIKAVYCFMNAHHLVLDPTLHKRVRPYPDYKAPPPMDGKGDLLTHNFALIVKSDSRILLIFSIAH